MSGYIGNIPTPQATQSRQSFTATAGQTTFATSGYTAGFLDVYLNGVHLLDGTDYTATNGSDIVLTVGAALDDVVEFVAYETFSLLDPSFTGTTTTEALTTTGAFTSLGIDDNAAATAMTLDASGKVGIGTTAPNELLEIEGGNMRFANTVSNDSRIYFTHTPTANRRAYMGALETDGNGNSLIFAPNANGFDASEAMRIDSSGNLLVGTTDLLPADNAVEGFVYKSGLSMQVHRDAGPALGLGRGTSNGAILNFNKDGTTVGSIGSRSAGTITTSYIQFYAGSSNSVGLGGTVSLAMLPIKNGTTSDNAIDLGVPSVRFDDIYATNGTIQTSDRNEKQDIDVLSDAETRVAQACKGLLRKFRWQDAVAEKGDDARIHFGIIAQDLQDAFTAEGLDAGRYAMFISSTWWEADRIIPAVEAVAEELDEDGNVIVEAVEAVAEQTVTDTFETLEEAPEGATERTRLGVRYPELLAFIIGAM